MFQNQLYIKNCSELRSGIFLFYTPKNTDDFVVVDSMDDTQYQKFLKQTAHIQNRFLTRRVCTTATFIKNRLYLKQHKHIN